MIYPRAGDFRHLVTLQKPDPTSVRDAVGERVTQWIDVADVYANVEPLSSRERFIAAQNQASISHTVTIFYGSAIADITSSWRVKFGNRYLPLSGDPVNPEERNVIFQLPCVEGLSRE